MQQYLPFLLTVLMSIAFGSAMLAMDLNDDDETTWEFWLSAGLLAIVYFVSISYNENWNILVYSAGFALSNSAKSLIGESKTEKN